MKRDFLAVALLWAVLTLAAELIILSWDVLPLAASKEALVVDHAYRVLTALAAPVFAFVVSTLLYSALRFRRMGTSEEDGPPIFFNRSVVATWLAVTTALTLLVIIYPGTTGLLELRRHAKADTDLVVQVEGSRWAWKTTYPQQGVVTYGEIVLPVGQTVRFDVTATDVLHSFWVPAFRVKVDAVPGRVTTVYATPNRTGSMADDSGFRLQCAELCGFGHYLMRAPVRVVEPAEFEAWLAQQPR
ncbi:MAG TPA: cytochrome c oxidase subunit II [Dehalococcoidia bacterium]|nr:cytochrome c oxidase subunit II [Dehalococcoidia bacterium]